MELFLFLGIFLMLKGRNKKATYRIILGYLLDLLKAEKNNLMELVLFLGTFLMFKGGKKKQLIELFLFLANFLIFKGRKKTL